MSRIRDRSTGDLLVLMVAGTVCGSILMTMFTVIIIEIIHPEANTDAAVRSIVGVVNTLIGLLAGFLAGKTGSTISSDKDSHS